MLRSDSKSEAGAAAACEELTRRAEAAAANSYSPYSGFKVGAALALTTGEVVTGTNVENASFGLTICAERSALVRAVAQHGPAIRLAAVAVVNLNGASSPPCGACRQMLAEFAAPDTPVSFPGRTGVVTIPLSSLLPLAFTAEDLNGTEGEIQT